ncbi:hypothetical protein BDN72DRAFT_831143 [Pluteus cervinus]|uniref:Uncharacterized protein n=1 Tax=Pluteus cervinus TaxID=181527 RepID=A0ACD3BFV9_9AGAR|nr:hypothetical protein BDN72DRAFT_831143 [Pluteus cervinus]
MAATPKMDVSQAEFCSLMQEMTSSLAATRGVIQNLRARASQLETKDGISLLTLKHHVFLSYLQSLVLLTARQALGHSLLQRSPPEAPFSSEDCGPRGSGLGDFVDRMIEGRVILEKIKTLESRMRYQIEKLVKLSEEQENTNNSAANDPLAFRPNPENLLEGKQDFEPNHSDAEPNDEIYRPPRLAPVPYIEKTSSQGRKNRPPVPSALASLAHSAAGPSRPHSESTSGLGSTPSLASARASQLKRMTEFEEENFTRLVMKKKDAKRRATDEAALALGGDLGSTSRGRRRVGGFEDEFGDVLRSVERRSNTRGGDGYDELRRKGRKLDVLKRSRGIEGTVRSRTEAFGDEEPGQTKKRSRFELATKRAKQKAKR